MIFFFFFVQLGYLIITNLLIWPNTFLTCFPRCSRTCKLLELCIVRIPAQIQIRKWWEDFLIRCQSFGICRWILCKQSELIGVVKIVCTAGLYMTCTEPVIISKQYECMLFVIQAWVIPRGYFPIYDRIYSLHLTPFASCTFYFFNICPDLRALSQYLYLDICHC